MLYKIIGGRLGAVECLDCCACISLSLFLNDICFERRSMKLTDLREIQFTEISLNCTEQVAVFWTRAALFTSSYVVVSHATLRLHLIRPKSFLRQQAIAHRI